LEGLEKTVKALVRTGALRADVENWDLPDTTGSVKLQFHVLLSRVEDLKGNEENFIVRFIRYSTTLFQLHSLFIVE
jgi:hypothetical protein